MNSKSRMILCSVGLFGIYLSANTLYAKPNSDAQTLNITIPKVTLVKLDKPTHSFTFAPDTFTVKHTTEVAISSNDSNARLNVQVKGLPTGLKLKIDTSANVCKHQLADSKTHGSFSCLVGMNRFRNGQLTMTASRENQQAVPDGNYQATLIYTLSD